MTGLASKTFLRLLLPYEQEIEKYPILPGKNATFYDRYYTTIQQHPRGGWFVTHSGGGYPLDSSPNQEHAVNIEQTYRVMVILDSDDFIPRKVYTSLLALVTLEKRELWIVTRRGLVDQGPREHRLYLLCPEEATFYPEPECYFTYITFEDHQDGGPVQVNTLSEPEAIERVSEHPHVVKDWYVIAHCERENAYGEMIPAEWFVLNAPYATREEAETSQARTVENTKGTDAEWPEANESAKIVHRDELAQYGLKPLNEAKHLQPYTCSECGQTLSFPEAFFVDGLTYCSDCSPDLSKDSQGW